MAKAPAQCFLLFDQSDRRRLGLPTLLQISRKRDPAKLPNPQLILQTLPSFAARSQQRFWQVKSIDAAKRTFGDKAEWKEVLEKLERDRKLKYNTAIDAISLVPREDGAGE